VLAALRRTGGVQRSITNLAVIEVTPDGLRLLELANDIIEDEVMMATEPPLL
jgi:3-oxoacid CoA-transferase subunit B